MSLEQEFQRAGQGGDTLARLARADWLEEGGDTDHAEFTRLLLQLDLTPTDPLLLARRNALLAEHPEWVAHGIDPVFEGGMLVSATYETRTMLHAALTAFPTLEPRATQRFDAMWRLLGILESIENDCSQGLSRLWSRNSNLERLNGAVDAARNTGLVLASLQNRINEARTLA
jgi:uncharacterized protein (TIGR02996 family)